MLLSMVTGVFSPLAVGGAVPPVWWNDRGVINQAASENNHAPVNLGQAKWMATQAYEELNHIIPGELGFVQSSR